MRWSLHTGATLHWHIIGEQQLVYQEESGDTHFLNSVAVELLKILETTELDKNQLFVELQRRIELSEDISVSKIQETLEMLERYGVLESNER